MTNEPNTYVVRTPDGDEIRSNSLIRAARWLERCNQGATIEHNGCVIARRADDINGG